MPGNLVNPPKLYKQAVALLPDASHVTIWPGTIIDDTTHEYNQGWHLLAGFSTKTGEITLYRYLGLTEKLAEAALPAAAESMLYEYLTQLR